MKGNRGGEDKEDLCYVLPLQHPVATQVLCTPSAKSVDSRDDKKTTVRQSLCAPNTTEAMEGFGAILSPPSLEHPTSKAVGLGGTSPACHGTNLQLQLPPAEPPPQRQCKGFWRPMSGEGTALAWPPLHLIRPPLCPPDAALTCPLTC